MTKVWVVAAAELGMLVRTKAFLITVLLMPVLMAASILIQSMVSRQVEGDRTPRRLAVIDRSGGLAAGIAAGARERDAALRQGLVPGAPFLPESVDPGAAPPDELRLEQSERVRRGEIFAFVDIPVDVAAPDAGGRIDYYSARPNDEELRRWVERVVNDLVRRQRLRGAGVDPEVVARLDRPVASEHLGLFTRDSSGAIRPAEKVDLVRTTVVPLALMYILFLTIFMSAPQLMNAVMQEKLSKISEVLIGSVTAFELMLGKLIGSAGMSFVLAVIYLGGGTAVAAYSGYGGALTPGLVAAFLLFMSLAVLFYGSLFIAVGAACSDLKDAQSLITPVMLIAVVPLFTWSAVLRAPTSAFAIAISLFPPATPFMMLLRLAVPPAPPAWQVVLGVALTAGAALGCVWAAGRIFRIGILATGKSAGVRQLVRWLRVK